MLPADDGGGETEVDLSRPNIVVIDLDRLTATHMPCYGYRRNTTPAMCRFGRENIMFREAVAQAGWTVPSVASIFTGQYPPVHGVRTRNDSLPPARTTLAERLSERGYTTAALPAWRRSGGRDPAFLTDRYGLDQGFDHYNRTGAFLHRNVPAALDWLATRDPSGDPFFLFVQGFDAHRYAAVAPYRHKGTRPTVEERFVHTFADSYSGPVHNVTLLERYGQVPTRIYGDGDGRYVWGDPDGRHTALSSRDVQHVIDHYDGEIRVADRWIARFLERFRDLPVHDETILVITSNHGEMIDTYTRAGGRRFGHGGVREGEIRVPLLIRIPGASSRTVDEQVELFDLMPTLLRLASDGADPGQAVQADGLGGLLAGEDGSADAYTFSTGVNGGTQSIRTGNWKYVAWRVAGHPDELVDVTPSPPIIREVGGDGAGHPDLVSSLEDRLREWRIANRRTREYIAR